MGHSIFLVHNNWRSTRKRAHVGNQANVDVDVNVEGMRMVENQILGHLMGLCGRSGQHSSWEGSKT